MYMPGPIQPYHFQSVSIWWDSPFNGFFGVECLQFLCRRTQSEIDDNDDEKAQSLVNPARQQPRDTPDTKNREARCKKKLFIS